MYLSSGAWEYRAVTILSYIFPNQNDNFISSAVYTPPGEIDGLRDIVMLVLSPPGACYPGAGQTVLTRPFYDR